MRLYLDDIRRSPIEEARWVTVETYEDAIMILARCWNDITEVSLDHDLGTEKTGYDVLCYIEETCEIRGNLPFYIWIHSQNPVGQEKMGKVVKALVEKYPKHEKEN